jgi:hypothetical protein
MWFERGMTILHAGFDLSRVPDPTWQHLLYWSNYRFKLFPLDPAASHWYGGYMGVTLVLLAGVGFVAPFVRRQMSGIVSGRAAAICLVAALILVFGYRWSVFQALAFVRAANSGRYLILVSFFLSLLAGIGAATLINKWGRNRIRTFTTLLLLIVLDLGPTTFQQPYLSAGSAKDLFKLPDDLDIETREPSGRIPDFRVFYTSHNVYRLQLVSWLPSAAGLTTFTEMFSEAPLSVEAFSRPLESTLNTLFGELESGEDLKSKENFSPAMLGVYLSNTKHIISYRPETGLVFYLPFPQASPVIVAGKAVGHPFPVKELEDPEILTKFIEILEAMGTADLETGSCDQILLSDFEGVDDLGTNPAVRVLDHRVWNQRVEVDLHVTERCFARLSYAHYPYLRVTVNGRNVEPLRTSDRFIALKLEAGEHNIVLEPYLSPLRKSLLILNICLVAAGALWIYNSRRNRVSG